MTTIEENIIIMHHGCALRQNASSQTISAMAQLGKPFEDAVAAALLTLGGSHGPVRDAQYAYTAWTDNEINSFVYDIIPGFGSAWFKDKQDPAIQEFMETLPILMQKDIKHYTEDVQEYYMENIFPNAALATACANIQLRRPASLGISLVIQGRILAWEDIYEKNYKYKGF